MRRIVAEVQGRYRVPAAVLGALACLAVAAVYAVVWPNEDAEGLAGVHRFVLRWAHPAVWVALAAACLLWGARASAGWPRRVASIGLVLYGAFVLALVLA